MQDPSTPSSTSGRPRHKKENSVIISIDQLQRSSMANIFGKSGASTTSLLKQHTKHKQQLQKCVDFVMTKANYRAIAAAGQFEKVKATLEDLDARLRDVKLRLTSADADEDKVKSKVKADLDARLR